MIVLEYSIEHPLLRQTRHQAPSSTVHWVDSSFQVDGVPQFLVWIESDDLDLVSAALDEDDSVSNPTVLVEKEARRLYRFEFTEDSLDAALDPDIVDMGGVIEEATADADGWWVRVRLPDRDAADCILQVCRERDLPFDMERLMEETDLTSTEQSTLTALQKETLLEALRMGYLEIPRECSLSDLSTELGVSQSAISQRFRRGVKNLITQTIRT